MISTLSLGLIASAFLATAIYTVSLCHKIRGVPSSISETYYLGGKLWFTSTMLTTAVLLTLGAVGLSPDGFDRYALAQGLGLTLIGLTPDYKRGAKKTLHYIGAIVFVAASQYWVAKCASPFLLLDWLLWGCCFHTPVRVFVAELLCVINIMSTAVVLYLA